MRPELLLFATLLKAAAVLVFASVADLALRKQSAAHRHLIWLITFGGLLVLAMTAPLANSATGALLPSVTVDALAASTSAATTHSDWTRLLFAIYSLGICLGLVRFVLDIVAAQRISQRATHVEGNLWSVSESITPAVWAGRILVPMEFHHWPEQRREAILLHERAHIARGDHWTSLLARLIAWFYWPIPIVWYALNRLRSEQERACDDAVVQSGVPASQYAQDLLSISGELQPVLAAPGATCGLSTRLHALLEPNRSRRALSRRAIRGSVFLALSVLLPLALMRAGDDKVYRASDGETPPKLILKTEPVYTQEARDAKISGTVVLYAEIDQEGRVREARVLRGIDAGLDQNSVSAVRQWLFEPGKKDGKPVVVAVTIEVNFRLQ